MASSRKGGPDLPGRVLASLGAHLRPGLRLTVAYSGGLDSSVLLHLLTALRPRFDFRLDAVHVHHGLSSHAEAWAEHCQAACEGLGVPLVVHRVRVEPAGEGPEAAARAARYRVFAALDTDVLALAHHRDDQAETVLAQLLRGGGARGLAAMPVARPLAGGRAILLRPLLDVPRSEILTWARERDLIWVEDDSNAALHLTRNALRHEVLPLLEARFPGVAGTLARTASRFAETAALLDDLAALDAGEEAKAPAIARLAALPEIRARNLLRRYLEHAGAEIHPDALREGLRQLLAAREDARVRVEFGPVALVRFGGRALVIPAGPPRRPPEVIWHGEPRLGLGDGQSLVFQAVMGEGLRLVPGRVRVGYRKGGEKLRLAANRPRRLLKDLLREAAIPPWCRDRLPLVFLDGRLVWAAGIGADVADMAGPGEPGWRIVHELT